MAKIVKNPLMERLDSLNLEKIAKETGFKQRSDQKIELKPFIVGFMMSFMAKSYSLLNWASAISLFLGKTVTKQSLQEKFEDCHQSGQSRLTSGVRSTVSSRHPV